MTATYDLATTIGQVRLNIPDNRIATAYFTDEDIQAFLDQEQNNVFFAAADGCDVMASDLVYLLSVQTSGDRSVNGAAVSAELRARAATLRIQGREKTGSSTISTGVAIVRNHRMLRGY